MNTTYLTCPYCGQDIEAGTTYDLIKQRTLATHKARCTEKRYLGGVLEMEIVSPEEGVL